MYICTSLTCCVTNNLRVNKTLHQRHQHMPKVYNVFVKVALRVARSPG